MKTVYKGLLLIAVPCMIPACKSDNGNGAGKRPNILIAMGDDISFPHMSAYGTGWVKTPGFDMVARNGILFYNAYTPNAKSSPSRACFLTGRNSWQLEEAANHVPYFPQKFKSFIETLGENGYFTGYTAKGWAPGTAVDSTGKPRYLTGKAFNSKRLNPPAGGISDIDYAANFEDFLSKKPEGSPFCFWYGSNEPHRDYEYGSGVNKGGKSLSDINHVPGFWPDNNLSRNDMLDYAYEIEHFDNHLVKMIDLLRQKGELDNTIIIVTADNGMPFPRAKGQVYEYSNHMPLAVMWRNGIRKPGRRIYDFISFIDFAPTLLETAGISQAESGMQKMEGRSFADIFRSSKNKIVDKTRNYVLLGRERNDVGRPDDEGYPVRGIISNSFLYLRNYKPGRWPSGNPETGYLDCDGSPVKSLILSLRRSGTTSKFWNLSFGMRGNEELYDIGNDPECLVNLVNNPGYASVWQDLRQRLFKLLLEQGDPRAGGNGDIFDKYPYANGNHRDFYNRFMKGELNNRSAGWVDSTDFEKK
ncbi:MAG TPA: sulfatase [Bacteroidales bacterium]|nr:sulfatase [Bacteroidales bacterium]HRR92540.1 sulfatase [Bacteroidales bacterium]HRT88790.1 sulfatase [Bacteroidales bacterium]